MLKRILRIELSDSYREIDRYRALLFHIVSSLSVCLPTFICDEFLHTQEKSCHLFFVKEKRRFESKFRWLFTKRKNNLSLESRLYNIALTLFVNRLFQHRAILPFSQWAALLRILLCTLLILLPFHIIVLLYSPVISIHPNFFLSQRSSSLTTVRDGWFLNLSSCDIPGNVQCFL